MSVAFADSFSGMSVSCLRIICSTFLSFLPFHAFARFVHIIKYCHYYYSVYVRLVLHICGIVAYDMKYIANVLLFDRSHVPALHVVATTMRCAV